MQVKCWFTKLVSAVGCGQSILVWALSAVLELVKGCWSSSCGEVPPVVRFLPWWGSSHGEVPPVVRFLLWWVSSCGEVPHVVWFTWGSWLNWFRPNYWFRARCLVWRRGKVCLSRLARFGGEGGLFVSSWRTVCLFGPELLVYGPIYRKQYWRTFCWQWWYFMRIRDQFLKIFLEMMLN